MINTLNWTSIELRIVFTNLLQNYPWCVNLSLPDYIQYSSQATKDNHLKYIQPATRIDAYKFSFYPHVFQQWNSLPDEIVSAQSIDLFRLKLLNFTNL